MFEFKNCSISFKQFAWYNRLLQFVQHLFAHILTDALCFPLLAFEVTSNVFKFTPIVGLCLSLSLLLK